MEVAPGREEGEDWALSPKSDPSSSLEWKLQCMGSGDTCIQALVSEACPDTSMSLRFFQKKNLKVDFWFSTWTVWPTAGTLHLFVQSQIIL